MVIKETLADKKVQRTLLLGSFDWIIILYSRIEAARA